MHKEWKTSLRQVAFSRVSAGHAKQMQDVHCVYMQLVRDAERLTPTEVACLPITLMQLYQKRSPRDQQAVTNHLFFDGIAKPWALEPAKLTAEVCSHSALRALHLHFVARRK